MTILEDTKERFPEFTEAQVNDLFPRVQFAWKHYFKRGYEDHEELVLNLIAHLMITESKAQPGAQNAIASRGAGGVNVSYHAHERMSRQDVFFGSTKYGQRYLELLSLIPVGPVFK